MLKENARLYNNVLSIFDVTITLIAFITGYYIRVFSKAGVIIFSNQYLTLGLLIIPIWYVLLKIINLQNSQQNKAYSIVIIEYFLVVVIGISVLFVFIFWFKLDAISRIAIFIFGIADLILLSVIKIIIISVQKSKTIKGKNVKNTLIFADATSIDFIEKIQQAKQFGYNINAIISEDEKIKSNFSSEYNIIKNNFDFNKYIENNEIDEVIYCKENINSTEIRNLVYSCEEVGVNFQLQSELFSLIASKSQLNYLNETPVLSISATSTDYFALSIKKTLDFVFALFALLITSPIMLIIAIAIKIESKGPILFKQKRVGLRGRDFTMYKFRTMVVNAEALKKELEAQNEVDGPVFKIKKDPRITKVGAFLRKTSLDEFPQFLNVLFGDMSVVGPRPPIRTEVEQYERWQLRRLSMKPGITCIWQVSGRNNISFDEWMKMDLQYIDNWSLRLDIMLIIKTFNAIFKRTGY